MATEGTKLQVNFKLADGTLINLYAVTAAELEANLQSISDMAQLILATGSDFSSKSNTAYATQAFAATTIEAPAQQYSSPTSFPEGQCRHGQLVWRESKPGAPKAWKGWFCPSPKGTPDQCEPKFVR